MTPDPTAFADYYTYFTATQDKPPLTEAEWLAQRGHNRPCQRCMGIGYSKKDTVCPECYGTGIPRGLAPEAETATPRTDTQEQHEYYGPSLSDDLNGMTEHARTLERDLAASEQRRQAAEAERDEQIASRNQNHHLWLVARKELDEERRKHEATVKDSEEAQEALSQAYYLIMGEAAEWSNNFGYEEAIECIDDAQRSLRATITNGFSELAAVRADRERLRETVKQLRTDYDHPWISFVVEQDGDKVHRERMLNLIDAALNPQPETQASADTSPEEPQRTGAESETPEILVRGWHVYLTEQFSATVGHIPLHNFINGIIRDRITAQQRVAELEAELVAQIKNRDDWRRDGATALAEADALRADNTSLQGFAKELMESWPEGGIDGGELQDTAEKWGLLKPVTATEP